jgi:septum formation protein
VPFTARPVDVVELDEGEPGDVARENAARKARAARAPGSREIVLGCDTLVALDGSIYGKPADRIEAEATLRALSGATHEVVGGLALLGDDCRTAVTRTGVTFRALDDELLDWYLATREWQGRAGGYAIQGAGAALVTAVQGDYENVVGLSVATLLDLCPKLLSRSG